MQCPQHLVGQRVELGRAVDDDLADPAVALVVDGVGHDSSADPTRAVPSRSRVLALARTRSGSRHSEISSVSPGNTGPANRARYWRTAEGSPSSIRSTMDLQTMP